MKADLSVKFAEVRVRGKSLSAAQKISKETDLEILVIEELQRVFKQIDHLNTQYLQFYMVEDFLKNMKLKVDDEVKQLIKEEQIRIKNDNLDFGSVCVLYQNVLNYWKQKQVENYDGGMNEQLNSFIAMGGELDRSGSVSIDYIIQIFEDIFDIIFDKQLLFQDFNIDENQTELDYDEFVTFFQRQDEKTGISILSQISTTSLTHDKQTDFKVKIKDFEQWERKQAFF